MMDIGEVCAMISLLRGLLLWHADNSGIWQKVGDMYILFWYSLLIIIPLSRSDIQSVPI